MNEIPAKKADKPALERKKKGSSVEAKSGFSNIVLGPDGKPCRACTDFKSWAKQMKGGSPANVNFDDEDSQSTKEKKPKGFMAAKTNDISAAVLNSSEATSEVQERKACPLDKEELGRNTWGFLHTMAGYYPEDPTLKQQRDMNNFINLFAKFYPCDWCAYHLRERLEVDDPDTSSGEKLSKWFCDYHNEVNRRLGKKEFDCSKVLERWKTGWADGSCD